ncbi:prolyl oligopeptidase family serine peptidase [Actinacidiphila alni]|uniref:S9 family peptidase n=1 Tax=Actinacidiphila alni TaxID=380248 RepID=UPI0033D434CB
MSASWQQFFDNRSFLKFRRGRGPHDLELAVLDDDPGPRLALWDVAAGRLRVLEGDFGDPLEAVPTADGRAVLALRDFHGSEVGHVWRTPVDGGSGVDLTPDLPPYVLRGIDTAAAGNRVLLTTVDDDGFRLWRTGGDGGEPPSPLFSSPHEAWNGVLSADGRLATVDTTDHNPGVRRFAVTCVGADDGRPVATLTDGPDGPVRAVRFSPVAGDPRVLVSTERTGFARPCVWNPVDGGRVDVAAPGLVGDLVALDWSPDATRVLAVHVDEGVHRVHEYDLTTGELRAVAHPDGAYFEPDVAAAHLNIWASHYGATGDIRLLRQRFDLPLSVLRADRAAAAPVPVTPALPVAPGTAPDGAGAGGAGAGGAGADGAGAVPAGTPLTSFTLRSKDGTPVQLWAARPRDAAGPGPLVLCLHGGPNMVTVGSYDPDAQAWLASGVGYAALNYRGSVTFGRDFREGFLGDVGVRETEDIEAAVTWLVDEGYAAKGQVFVTGASYGGFLTLLSAGRLPGHFAGALAHVPMADWTSAYEDMNPALQAACRTFLGATLEEAPEHYRRSSPISYVSAVRAPVWISQAEHDTRTPARQVHRYATALQEAGGDVVVEWYDGGHETSSRTKSVTDHARMAALVRAAVDGVPWSTGPVRQPPSVS